MEYTGCPDAARVGHITKVNLGNFILLLNISNCILNEQIIAVLCCVLDVFFNNENKY